MLFTPTAVDGAVVVDLEPRRDDRGFFARRFDVEEFRAHGMTTVIAQSNVSTTKQRGTVRGMHYQTHPALESKLVRCTRGAIFDVAVDVRPGSPTYGQWVGVELTEGNGRALYVPEGCAHGFQTLVDGSAILYDASAPYTSQAVRGVRYDDPVIAVQWPIEVTVVSEQDTSWPLLESSAKGG